MVGYIIVIVVVVVVVVVIHVQVDGGFARRIGRHLRHTTRIHTTGITAIRTHRTTTVGVCSGMRTPVGEELLLLLLLLL